MDDGYPISSRKDPFTGFLGFQRQQLRLRRRLRHVSSTSAARQHGRRRNFWSENEIVDFPGKVSGHLHHSKNNVFPIALGDGCRTRLPL